MNKRTFRVFVILIVGVGILVGFWLATMPRFESYTLVNLAGLLYDFMGIVVLSEMIASNPRWKDLSVDVTAPVILWLQSLVPFGMMFMNLTA